MRHIRLATLAWLACIALPLAAAPVPSAIAVHATEYLDALLRLHQFSGTVLIEQNGITVLSRGFGLADLEANLPNRPGTKFRIGSITKQFTATAILLLQQRHLLQVTDPICNYVPECPTAWQPITIHQLLTHTSGIPDFTEAPGYDTVSKSPVTPEQLVASFKQKPLDFPPGTSLKYSNSGYEVLGQIIERVSGTSYQTFLQNNIFKPLRLHSTGYDVNAQILIDRAHGYTRQAGLTSNADYVDMSVPYAAGGLYSTAPDLLRWSTALFAGKLLQPASLKSMFTPYRDTVGYGWTIDQQFGRKMISHEGSVNGFASNIAIYPDDQTTVIVLANLETAPISKIAKDLAGIVFHQPVTIPKAPVFIHLDPAALAQYSGRYPVDSVPDIIITITVKANKLLCEVQGSTFVLAPESATTFSDPDGAAHVVFRSNSQGRIQGLTFNGQFKATRAP